MKKTKLNTFSLKNGSLIRFHKEHFGYGILSIFENLERFIICRAESELPQSLKNGDSLDLYFWSDNKGSYVWNSYILGSIIDNEEKFIIISHSKEAKWSPERSCVRSTVPLLFEFFSFPHSQEGKIFESSETHFHSATIIELTDYEAIIETDDEIEGPIIKGHLTLKNHTIDIAGKISVISEGRYHIQMLSMEERDRKTLLDFIYRNCRE